MRLGTAPGHWCGLGGSCERVTWQKGTEKGVERGIGRLTRRDNLPFGLATVWFTPNLVRQVKLAAMTFSAMQIVVAR